MSDVLFRSKKKNILVGALAAAYLLITLLSADFVLYDITTAASWRYNLNTLFVWLFGHSVMICVIIYLLTLKKEFRFKKWILPIGFGLSCLSSLLNFPYAVRVVSEYTTFHSVIIFVFTCLSALAVLLCFVGTLFDFEYIKLFRAGILLQIAVLIVSQITETVFNATNGYFATYGLAGLSIPALVQLLILLLFYISLYPAKT